ncbi:hypothetical protein EYF80_012769 [Liparis tanakae]|uniref:Uncharacterized protein n=1 Tax=Liparis tanakae TaxID=230148 RepID=A0A4Z2IIA4_9TELE|nr:hypothetical protein EYF80_012769 [Liparis tanakae]
MLLLAQTLPCQLTLPLHRRSRNPSLSDASPRSDTRGLKVKLQCETVSATEDGPRSGFAAAFDLQSALRRELTGGASSSCQKQSFATRLKTHEGPPEGREARENRIQD